MPSYTHCRDTGEAISGVINGPQTCVCKAGVCAMASEWEARRAVGEPSRDTLSERLQRLRDIYDTKRRLGKNGWSTSSHARHNLEGALIDLERQGADTVCLKTIRRVIDQLAAMEQVLEL